MNNISSHIPLIVISVMALFWLAYWRTPSLSIHVAKSQNTETPLATPNHSPIDGKLHTIADQQQSLCPFTQFPSRPSTHTKLPEPIDSTFKPTPNTCPYRE